MSDTVLTKTIDWDGKDVIILDQTHLPQAEVILRLHDIGDMCEAISNLRVRGAMALGVGGALGIALAVTRASESGGDIEVAAAEASRALIATRPTAVNLAWGIRQVMAQVPNGLDAVVASAVDLLEKDSATNHRVAEQGLGLLQSILNGNGRPRFLTHCNAGALAGVDWGTSLGIIRIAHDRDWVEEVFVSETRPLLQGARLTSWELQRLGVPHRVIVDSAGPWLIASGLVDAVLIGADRIAANGDVANKIGSYAHALAAKRASVPFVVAAPESTIDSETATGADIPMELRAEEEVLEHQGRSVVPLGTHALNPAFDVTPADLVTAIVTEQRIIRLDRGERPT